MPGTANAKFTTTSVFTFLSASNLVYVSSGSLEATNCEDSIKNDAMSTFFYCRVSYLSRNST